MILPQFVTRRQWLMQLVLQFVGEKAHQWIFDKLSQLEHQFTAEKFYMAFAAAPRVIGKNNILFTLEEKQMQGLHPHFAQQNWTADQLARAILLLSVPQNDAQSYLKVVQRLFELGEVGELVTLYKSLPLLPFPESFLSLAKEGVRTNITSVFEALSLHNPYPADHFDTPTWNQMVLKAVFIGMPIQKIVGLQQRANAQLAGMLIDFAHERWAAGRVVPPDLWLPVTEFVNENTLADLEKMLTSRDTSQRLAAALVCYYTTYSPAKQLLSTYPDLEQKIAQGFQWKDL
ncbi:MAG: EboA domain-containing protein [Cytophagales bacterium]|nr:EboA domain-containing protein [Bernardetiaceae bacterium]MDW8209623.1 EboA domain-containing protein [Cytophagales bacterium]